MFSILAFCNCYVLKQILIVIICIAIVIILCYVILAFKYIYRRIKKRIALKMYLRYKKHNSESSRRRSGETQKR